MLNLHDTFIDSLKGTKYISNDNQLLTGIIIQAIDSLEQEFLEKLLENETLKKHFTQDIAGATIIKQNQLFEFFSSHVYQDNSYTSYSNKIGLIKKDSFIKKFDDVVLSWPYKDCVLEGGMSTEEKSITEVFYNEIISKEEIDRLFEPKVLTNIKKFEKGENGIQESVPTKITEEDNLILKGNNLIALHSLKKKYSGKVKLIYIDPPYNTGNDSFKYNDRFNHSTWLTFMKNRLEVARELLSDDGVIFVSIDNSPSDFKSSPELGYLLVLMDEIFDRRNYITSLVWKKKGNASNTKNDIGTITESILMYAKNIEFASVNLQEFKRKYQFEENNESYNLEQPIKTNDGEYERKTMQYTIKTNEGYFSPPEGKRWTIGEETAKQYVVMGKYKIINGNFYIKKFMEDYKKGESKLYNNLLLEQGSLKSAKTELYNLGFNREDFDTPKPEALIQRIIEISTKEKDLVLDFHLGSGTTCAVAHKMGRRYIGIEQMDYIETIAVERMKKVLNGEQGGISKSINWEGGGSFIFAELKTTDKFQECDEIGKLNQNLKYVPISEIDDEDYGVSDTEKALNKQFYGVE